MFKYFKRSMFSQADHWLWIMEPTALNELKSYGVTEQRTGFIFTKLSDLESYQNKVSKSYWLNSLTSNKSIKSDLAYFITKQSTDKKMDIE